MEKGKKGRSYCRIINKSLNKTRAKSVFQIPFMAPFSFCVRINQAEIRQISK